MKKSPERLVLGTGGHSPVDRKVGEEGFDLRFPQLPRVPPSIPHFVEPDELVNPPEVTLLRFERVVEKPQFLADLVVEFHRWSPNARQAYTISGSPARICGYPLRPAGVSGYPCRPAGVSGYARRPARFSNRHAPLTAFFFAKTGHSVTGAPKLSGSWGESEIILLSPFGGKPWLFRPFSWRPISNVWLWSGRWYWPRSWRRRPGGQRTAKC